MHVNDEFRDCVRDFYREEEMRGKELTYALSTFIKTKTCSSKAYKAPSTCSRVNLKPRKHFHGYAFCPHITG